MLPTVLVPGLNCSAVVYAGQIPALWPYGPVTVANHTIGDTIAEIAAAILANAPPRFRLAGFSMGGYIVQEMVRQARERVVALALIDTSARPDSAEQSANRRRAVALAEAGKFQAVLDQQFPLVVDASHAADAELKRIYMTMAHGCGPALYARHQQAIIGRADSRASLAAIDVSTLVLVGESDTLTPPDGAREMATGIAGARLVEIVKAGHLSLLEQPEAINAALSEWAALVA